MACEDSHHDAIAIVGMGIEHRSLLQLYANSRKGAVSQAMSHPHPIYGISWSKADLATQRCPSLVSMPTDSIIRI